MGWLNRSILAIFTVFIMVSPGLPQGLSLAAQPQAIRLWIAQGGTPWGYITRYFVYIGEDGNFQKIRELHGIQQVILSPNGRLALLAQPEPYHSRIAQSLHTRFLVMDRTGEINLDWQEDNAADETRWQAAIGNGGFIGLLDPGYARVKIISPRGQVIVDRKLKKQPGLDPAVPLFNLERKGRLGWIRNQLIVVLEERAFQPEKGNNVSVFSLETGEKPGWETTANLTQIQAALFDSSGIFISGYDWRDNGAHRDFTHRILQLSPGKGLVTRSWPVPARDLTLSPNGQYLGVLEDSRHGRAINLATGDTVTFTYKNQQEFLQGLAINDQGEVAVIAIRSANYHSLEILKDNRIKIIKPFSGETIQIPTGGVFPDQLKLSTDGRSFYLGDSRIWRAVGQ